MIVLITIHDTSHFYAHIGAAPKVFHPPMSKLMWV